jgi:hypothetical protein
MNNEAVSDFVQRRNLPLVVFDSCALLDIPRLKYGPETLEVLNLCYKQGSDKFTYLLPNQVVREIGVNLSQVALTSCHRLKDSLSLCQAIKLFEKGSLEVRIEQQLTTVNDTIMDIVTQSVKLDDSDSYFCRAMNRMINRKKPSHPTRSSYGDCLILESILDCSTQLRNNGFDKDIMFVTTNPDDFSANMQEHKSAPHPDFAGDFSSLRIVYLTDLRPLFYETSLQKIKATQNL